jgi:RNA polymerase sigma factor (sigma-70 family)
MRATDTTEVTLVVAAQAGDRWAVDELVTTYLPLVYNIVGRALSGHPDVDDIVQDTMLRALRDLGSLRTPESFRSWLATIAVRQISTHRQRRDAAARRTTALDDAADVPGAGSDFEDLTILRLGLSGQRRQVVRASRWLDPDDKALLSLWWLEAAGHLTRTELAAGLGLTAAHAGVRVQRMRDRLDLSRSLVAALERRPGCAGLDTVVAGWSGEPGPLWRKRIARHTRSCATCGRATADLVPVENLLLGLALVPVPVLLAAALVGKSALAGAAAASVPALPAAAVPALPAAAVPAMPAAAVPAMPALPAAAGSGVKAGLLGQLAHAAVAHPLMAMAVAGGLIAGAAVGTAARSTPPARPPGAMAAGAPVPAIQSPGAGPSATAPSVPLGPISLESANATGRFVAYAGEVGLLSPVDVDSAEPARLAATFEVVAGLAGAGCVSFRARDGRYLRHTSWRLRLNADDGTALLHGDATFCARAGATPDSIAWESYNYPGSFLRHIGEVLWVDRSDGTAIFRADSSFRARPPLAG